MVLPKLLLQCYITIILTISSIHSFSTQSSSTRRNVLEQIKNLSISPFVATSLSNVNNVANAVESTITPIEASWKAVDGLNSSDEGRFVSFDKSGELYILYSIVNA